MSWVLADAFLFAVVLQTAPLLLAALGGIFSQQAAVLNVALEGMMLMAAFTSIVVGAGTHSTLVAILAAMSAGVALSLIFGVTTLYLGADVLVVGIGITIFATGLSVLLLATLYGGERSCTPDFPHMWELSSGAFRHVPVLGPAFTGQSALVLLAFALVPVASFVLFRTRFGLRVRAVGEYEPAVTAAGLPPRQIRMITVVISGAMCGLAGAQLAMGTLGEFVSGMTAGRGFIALAAIFVGRARPGPVMAACLLFGFTGAAANELQLQHLPSELVQMLPVRGHGDGTGGPGGCARRPPAQGAAPDSGARGARVGRGGRRDRHRFPWRRELLGLRKRDASQAWRVAYRWQRLDGERKGDGLANFVMVPGSYLGGWCWRHVADRLRAYGHRVYTPTLTGLGDRTHQACLVKGITTHIVDLTATLEAEEIHDAVIVSHSYGGAVMTGLGAAAQRSVRTFVYLDAAVPNAGQSVFDLTGEEFANRYRRAARLGLIPLLPGTAERWAVPEGEARDWLIRRATPHPLTTLEEPLDEILAPGHIRRAYIYCTIKPGIDVFKACAEEARGSAEWAYYELETGHLPQLGDPAPLAALLHAIDGIASPPVFSETSSARDAADQRALVENR